MKKIRDYIVTYTTLDNKTRSKKKRLVSDDEKVIDKIIEFVETKKWPEEPYDYTVRNMEWGLAPYQTMGVRRYGNQRQFPNESQYRYCGAFQALLLQVRCCYPGLPVSD